MLVGTELAAKGNGDIMVLNDSMAGADLTEWTAAPQSGANTEHLLCSEFKSRVGDSLKHSIKRQTMKVSRSSCL